MKDTPEILKAKHQLWRRGELDFLLHPAQLLIYKNIQNRPEGVHKIVNECARRFGKSYLGIIVGLEHCLKNSGTVVRLVAPTKEQGYEIANSLMRTILETSPSGLVIPMKSKLRWKVGKSEFIIGGVTNYDTLRGTEASLIILEEPRDVLSDKLEDCIKSVLAPQLLTTKGWLLFNSTTPKHVDHYFLTHIVPEAKQENTYNRYTIYDNPMLDAEQIDMAIKESGGETTSFFRREYLCEPVHDGAAMVIPAFSNTNVTTNESSSICWIAGDTGGVTDKTVIHLWTFNEVNTPMILKEFVYDSNTSTNIIAACIATLQQSHDVPVNHVWLDAHGQTLVDLRKTHGLTVNLPPKQDRESAIRALNTAFYCNQVLVNQQCQHTIKALRSGMWNDRGTDFVRTTEFGHLDAVMATVYGFRVAGLVNQQRRKPMILWKRETAPQGIPQKINWKGPRR